MRCSRSYFSLLREKVCDVVLEATRSRSVGLRAGKGEEAANGKQDRFSVRSLMSGTDGMGRGDVGGGELPAPDADVDAAACKETRYI